MLVVAVVISLTVNVHPLKFNWFAALAFLFSSKLLNAQRIVLYIGDRVGLTISCPGILMRGITLCDLGVIKHSLQSIITWVVEQARSRFLEYLACIYLSRLHIHVLGLYLASFTIA